MYNHNKAQQSKNRVHISWDILYVCKKTQKVIFLVLYSMGFFISTKQSIIVIVAFVSLVVAVGLLAGLINPPGDLKGGSNDGQVSTLTYFTSPIWRCRKPINQWQCGFHMKAVLPLVKKLATASDRKLQGPQGWSQPAKLIGQLIPRSHVNAQSWLVG